LVIYSRFSRSYNFLFRFNYSNAIHSTLILSVFWKNSTIQKNKKQRKQKAFTHVSRNGWETEMCQPIFCFCVNTERNFV
jgi:hypothetical protein